MHMKKISLLSIALSAMLSLAGCAVVDSPVEQSVETTITPYYFKLTEGHHYTFMVEDKRFAPDPYTLTMEMDGEYEDTYRGKQMFECDWYSSAMQVPGDYYHGYYAMDAQSAYYMGSNPKPEPSQGLWLDLVAPIKRGQKWSFAYGMDTNNTIDAEITKTGLTAALPDSTGTPVTYKDVIEVVYQGADDKTVKWFAKDHAMLAEWRYNSKGEIVHKKVLWSYKFGE
jgi:hypothetical protein